ncbi:hypothetical protein N7474_009836 [Penicillium riverlandense]|uniref:uncharacterized protein n=1 Tax=Penicillium riverlandense TaxID=1903569 RepID=UPI002547F512|nr:uncharacterized protein N7474_009836 [Penicillium riverlandense]KAJ5808567.1 hypothetical protein N7474_009836 [Penicillium riverlandense]
MEEVYDLGSEADDALVVQQILEYLVMQYLEDLDNDDLYSRKHSKSNKESADQHDTLKEINEEIWSSLKRVGIMTGFNSLPCLDTKQKQEALKTAMKCGEVNQRFLSNLILRTWEGVRDARKKSKKRRDGVRDARNKPKKSQLELEVDTRKVVLPITPSSEVTTTDLQPHTVTFACLDTLTDNLLNKLVMPHFVIHRLKSYQNEIESFGSLHPLKDRMMKCILPEVRALEGKDVTRQMLDDVLGYQGPITKWPAIGGYLLYITSSEAEEFWRPYAGQGSLLKRRIPQHITEVLHGRNNTLCYWVASKPGRQLNFIRLWEIIEEDEDTRQSIELLNNLLEMVFCLAFQSLPLPTLERFLGAGTEGFSLQGLNVISPLLQNVILTPKERAECRSWLAHSPSYETQEFAKARQAQLQQQKRSALQPCSRRPHPQEIELACHVAISPHLSSPFVGDNAKIGISNNSRRPIDPTTIDYKVARYLDQQGVMEHLHALPFGSMTEAHIGFVLDFDIFSLKHNRESTLPVHFPSALGYIGFHKQNCLVWPFNFQVPYTPRKFKLAGPEDKFLSEINSEIIDMSNLQVVILCGTNTERLIVMSDPSIKKIKIDIGKVSLDAYLQIEQPQSVLSRVYLKLPAPLSALHSRKVRRWLPLQSK